MMKKLPKGFTLVELLVVMAIISVLAVIGLVVFVNLQRGARDARRKADIDAIAQAMEARYDYASGQYAAIDDSWFSSRKIPLDPLNTFSTTGPNDACPGVCHYCVEESDTTKQNGRPCGYHPITLNPRPPVVQIGPPTRPSGGTNRYWAVCVNLEGGGYYCRANAQ